MKRFLLSFLLLFTFTLPAVAQKNTYRLLLHWYPQAQFAGYYYALEKGFYKDADLDIQIIYGTVTTPSSQILKSGDFDFATLWLSTAMQLKASKVPLQLLAQTNQSSALMLVSHKGRGVDRLEDFAGKKIGIWSGDFELQPLSLLSRNNINMQVIIINNSINLFLRGAIDVCMAMWYNEYHEILSAGLREEDLNIFRMSDYGMNFPEDGIYVHEKLAWNRPGVCKKFVEASLRGWMAAFEDVEGTLDILEKACNNAGVPFSRAHQRWMLNCFRELLIHPRTNKIEPTLPVHAYNFVGSVLLERNFIKSIPPYETFVANL
ncbi:MAG TPA: ABC transporter substrate-binding protein [Bacteroidales bacterium]|nr:ABC transporter substrate-binding protein [Bacteroidales bacterium]MCZ2416192.1 ABC transporter substrate-binding protein [Burkholderiales bacterium]OQC58272.1 MAG: putative thiamine biosynthesis protein [Bacteroidetes bacterium ADurb.Bin013]MBP8998881.1 ABC transporter substrate-binding protein [Bacteroidales bacterium]MBV6456042.1 hypothetical protein [Bacteroidales bacterium]